MRTNEIKNEIYEVIKWEEEIEWEDYKKIHIWFSAI